MTSVSSNKRKSDILFNDSPSEYKKSRNSIEFDHSEYKKLYNLFYERISSGKYNHIIYDIVSVKEYLNDLNKFIGTDALKSSILEDCISSLCKKEEQLEISAKIHEILSEIYIRKITEIDKKALSVLPSPKYEGMTNDTLEEMVSGMRRTAENLKLNLTYMLTAPPGTGKTTIAKICSGLMASLGIITQPESSDNKFSEREHHIKMITKYGDIFNVLERQMTLVNNLQRCQQKMVNPESKECKEKITKLMEHLSENLYVLDEMPNKAYNRLKALMPSLYTELTEMKEYVETIESCLTKYAKNTAATKKMTDNCHKQTNINMKSLMTDMNPHLSCGSNPHNPNYDSRVLSSNNPKRNSGKINSSNNMIIGRAIPLQTFLGSVFSQMLNNSMNGQNAQTPPEESEDSQEETEPDEECCGDDEDEECTKPENKKNTSGTKELNFGIYSREHFVAGYVGQSALKTIALLNKHLGGSIVIDEAYSLILEDGKDSFGMEVLTTINRFITEHLGEIIIYFAGYEDKMQLLFRSQPGLKRRIHKTYKIEPYTSDQLHKIFMSQLADKKIAVEEEDYIKAHFHDNLKKYPYFGGDTFMLVQACSIILDIEKFKMDKDEIPVIPPNMLTKKMFLKAFNRFEGSKGKTEEDDFTKKPEYLNFYL
jgi:hypothetical protein